MRNSLVFENVTRKTILVERVRRTRHTGDRLLGLMGRGRLEVGEGLWITPCRAIHTFGMRFPIDAIYLDGDLRVVGVQEGVRPFRLGSFFRAARSVLETAPGSVAASGTEVGDQLAATTGK